MTIRAFVNTPIRAWTPPTTATAHRIKPMVVTHAQSPWLPAYASQDLPASGRRQRHFKRALEAITEPPTQMRTTFEQLWDTHVVFRDPFNQSVGVQPFIQHIESMIQYGHVANINIESSCIDGNQAQAKGFLVFCIDKLKIRFYLKFATQMVFNHLDQIVDHTDIWDWRGSLLLNIKYLWQALTA